MTLADVARTAPSRPAGRRVLVPLGIVTFVTALDGTVGHGGGTLDPGRPRTVAERAGVGGPPPTCWPSAA